MSELGPRGGRHSCREATGSEDRKNPAGGLLSRTEVPQQGPVAERRLGVSGTKSHREAEAFRLNRYKILSIQGRTSNELDSYNDSVSYKIMKRQL